MTQEALKLALEFIENSECGTADLEACIKEALAQTQEPVAFWNFNSGFSHCMIDQLNEAAKKNPAPLYTTPPQRTWVGLTDEERQDIALEVPIDAVFITEAKLKEKNI